MSNEGDNVIEIFANNIYIVVFNWEKSRVFKTETVIDSSFI